MASGVPIGLPNGDSPYAGTGVFVPHVIVRNLIGTPQTVAITVEYPGEKEPQLAPLAPLALGPYATVDVVLDSVFGMLPLPLPFCSIRIQYTGPPGSAIAEVSSVETKGDLVIDSRVANERDGWAGAGGHPWHLDEETESIMFLTNMGERPARIGFDVVAGGTHYYLTRLKLQPRETRAIDLRKLRDAQKADFREKTIPAEASDGSVIWSRLDNIPVMGRLVVLQRHKGISSNYDCGICDCPAAYVDLEVEPYSVDLIAGDSALLDAEAKFDEYCNSYYWWCSVPATWTSLSPTIATVDDWGDVTGISGGTATIKATYCDYYYTYDSQIQDCVEHPRCISACATAHVVTPYPVYFTQNSSSVFGSGQLQFTYQWGSSTGNPDDLHNCLVGELVTYQGYVPGQQHPFFWPSPPWVAGEYSNNPTIRNVAGNNGYGCVNGVPPCFTDRHSHGTFASPPYADANFSGTQVYRYQCLGVNNGNPVTLMGPMSIVRSVTHSGSTYTYRITKSGLSASCILGQTCTGD